MTVIFWGFKKAQKAHNRRYFFLHIAFFTQNTKTLLGEKGIELSLILATLNSYLIWWTGGSLGTGPYVRVDTITDDASGLKRLGLYKLEDIHLMMNLSQTHYYFINVGGGVPIKRQGRNCSYTRYKSAVWKARELG